MIFQERIREVFAEVESLPPEQLTRRLAVLCAGDPELEAELRSLLEAHRRAGSFLEEPPSVSEDLEAAPLESGALLGCYRLVRELGRGGMATVWLAERADGSFRKRVAIKLLRGEWNREDAVRRFHRERQTLAALEHPCIAGLLDGGTAPDGRPYLVMEYVEGRPLDLYCREERLSLRERLELFQKVCTAVQFAHQNLVIHRDLKPQNILVTPDETPKLLDFGICKLINPDLSETGSSGPAAPSRFMTPEYASPEQARGGPVTTASDVYALGAVLYLLLTGSQLVEAGNRSPAEVLHEVRTTSPERPSVRIRRTSSGRSEPIPPRRLAGDLDHIVLRAVASESRHRYGTAGELAADLQRYLTDRPVEARRSTGLYRLHKFVRRHRWGVGAAAGIMTLMLGFGALLAGQRTELARAQVTSDALTGFLLELFEMADPLGEGDPTVTAQELLDLGVERAEHYFSDQPEIRAYLQRELGEIYLRWGALDSARVLLTLALETQSKLRDGDHPEVARGLARLGRLSVLEGDFEHAEELLDESLAVRLRLFGEGHVETADSLNEIGFLHQHRGRLDEAVDSYRRALEIWQTRRQGTPAEIARVLNNLASVQVRLGDASEAERLYRRALALRRQYYGVESVETSETLHNLSHVLRVLGNSVEARSMVEQALEIRRRILGDDHPRTNNSLTMLASLQQDLGELAAAESLFRQVLHLHRRRAEGRSTVDLAVALNNLASVVEEQRRPAEAEALYAESSETARQALGSEHYVVGLVITNLARVLDDQRRTDEALPLAREALEILEAAWGREHERTAVAESVLAGCLLRHGEPAEASSLLRHSLPILRASQDGRADKWRSRAEGLFAELSLPGEGEPPVPPIRQALEASGNEAGYSAASLRSSASNPSFSATRRP